MKTLLSLMMLAIITQVQATEVLSPTHALYKRCSQTQDNMSCFELSSQLERSNKKDKADKVALFACQRMTGKTCTTTRASKLRAEHLKSKRELEVAREKLLLENTRAEKNPDEVKCEQGQADACNKAGIYYQYLADQVDGERARKLYEKGCAMKDKGSCDALDLMRKGIGKVFKVDVGTPADEGLTEAKSDPALDFLKDEDWFPSANSGAKTPCDFNPERKPCTIGPGGWQQVALQKYDDSSPTVTIWESNGRRVICTFPSSVKSCASYGGDLKRFIEDSERETASRRKRKMEEELSQKHLAAAYQKAHKDKGPTLSQEGWKEVARCTDGHEWHYLIQNGDQIRKCSGINALSGPTEYPCVPFKGDVSEFRKCSK